MCPTKKTDERSLAAAALDQLRPPTDEMLFEPETAKASRELDQMLKHGSGEIEKTQAALHALNTGPPVMYTRGGGFAGAARVGIGSSFLDDLLGL
jgi:hypothetical protein